MIKQQGLSLMREENQKFLPDQEVRMRFSNGWLYRFQKRWNFRSRKMHGEGGDAVMDGIDEQIKLIKDKLRQFKPQNIRNADETGLFICMPPERNISSQPMPGGKNEKRMTLLVCTNADGSQKCPLWSSALLIGLVHLRRRLVRNWALIIGASKRPGWTIRFFDWLKRFSSLIANRHKR